MTYENPWTFNSEIFDSEHIEDYFGFCYLITNLKTGKKYVGRKYFFTNRKNPKVKRGKRIIKESDWKTYYGSCKPLLEEIQTDNDLQNYKREILSLHKTKGMVNFHEVQWQFDLRVLTAKDKNGERLFYNDQILNRYYAKNIKD